MRNIFLLLIIILCFNIRPGFSQSSFETIETQIENAKEEDRPALLNDLSMSCLKNREFEKAEEVAKNALQIARKYNDYCAIASAERNLSGAYKGFGKKEAAIEHYLNAIRFYGKCGDYITQAKVQNILANLYWQESQFEESAILYSKSLKYWESKDSIMDQGKCLLALSNVYFKWGKYQNANDYNLQAQKLFEKINFEEGQSTCYNTRGAINEKLENFDKAIEYYTKSLEIRLRLKNDFLISEAYNNLGIVYSCIEKYDTALFHLDKALEIREKLGLKLETAETKHNIGLIYRNKDTLLSVANRYFEDALLVSREIGVEKMISENLVALGGCFILQNKYDQALAALIEGVNLAEKNDIRDLIKEGYNELSQAYDSLADYKQAYLYYKKYRAARDSIYDLEKNKQINDIQTQYETDKKEQQLEVQDLQLKQKDAEYSRQQTMLYSAIAGLVVILGFSVILFRFYRQKQKANRLLHKQRDEITRQRDAIHEQAIELEKLSIVASETDNAVIIADAGGQIEWVNDGFKRLFGFTLEEFFERNGSNLIKSSSESNIQHKIAECIEKRKSVMYESSAVRKDNTKLYLQTTLTPVITNGEISKLIAIDSDITKIKLAEIEILQQKEEITAQRDQIEIQHGQIQLKNKHITDSIRYALRIQQAILPSASMINALLPDSFILYRPKDIVSGDFYWIGENDKRIYFSVVDCTGHGVPGAFMSMVGSGILNQAMQEEDIESPAQILGYLSERINETLQQTDEDKMVKDGMDLALCSIDKVDGTIEFAGVHNSIYVVKGDEIIRYTPDSHPIGEPFNADFLTYSNLVLDAEKGDTIYLFSDGYPDQKGGPKEKKFMSSQFRQKLLEYSLLPTAEQEKILGSTFDDWKGDIEQYDDVTVMGVRI
ncbi:MAG: tetratricopeptide repeat protein [Bacteroidetes bacterium]|nr:tetratricopeptide repeat protein [Bacteroidota bacterium]